MTILLSSNVTFDINLTLEDNIVISVLCDPISMFPDKTDMTILGSQCNTGGRFIKVKFNLYKATTCVM